MWCLIYTAISEHYGSLERKGQITDEELETMLLQLQQASLEALSDLYETLFDKPATNLED